MKPSVIRNVLTPAAILQLLVGWGGVVLVTFGSPLFNPPVPTGILLVVLLAIRSVIIVAAFGVVTQAEHLARRLGDPYGTLVLTLSIVLIEVILIAAVMLGPGSHPTIARESVMAVAMIILNLTVGIALLVGGRKHTGLQANRRGVAAYLTILLPFLTAGLVLPNFIGTDGMYSISQALPVTALTVVVYGVFLYFQTGRQRTDFQELSWQKDLNMRHTDVVTLRSQMTTGQVARVDRRELLIRTILLVATLIPIVLLSQEMASYLDALLDRLGAPVALSGLIIAAIVFLPETVTTVRAAAAGEIQRVSNLCHGALVSTVGLTIPVVLILGIITGQPVVLGEDPANLILLALSLILTAVTFLAGRTNQMHGIAHLMAFGLYALAVFG